MKAVLTIELNLNVETLEDLAKLLNQLQGHDPDLKVSVTPKPEPVAEVTIAPEPKPKRKRRTTAKPNTDKPSVTRRKVVTKPIEIETPEQVVEETAAPAEEEDPDAILKAAQKKVVELPVEKQAPEPVDHNTVFSALVTKSQTLAIELLEKHTLTRFSDAEGETLVAMMNDAQAILSELNQKG